MQNKDYSNVEASNSHFNQEATTIDFQVTIETQWLKEKGWEFDENSPNDHVVIKLESCSYEKGQVCTSWAWASENDDAPFEASGDGKNTLQDVVDYLTEKGYCYSVEDESTNQENVYVSALQGVGQPRIFELSGERFVAAIDWRGGTARIGTHPVGKSTEKDFCDLPEMADTHEEALTMHIENLQESDSISTKIDKATQQVKEFSTTLEPFTTTPQQAENQELYTKAQGDHAFIVEVQTMMDCPLCQSVSMMDGREVEALVPPQTNIIEWTATQRGCATESQYSYVLYNYEGKDLTDKYTSVSSRDAVQEGTEYTHTLSLPKQGGENWVLIELNEVGTVVGFLSSQRFYGQKKVLIIESGVLSVQKPNGCDVQPFETNVGFEPSVEAMELIKTLSDGKYEIDTYHHIYTLHNSKYPVSMCTSIDKQGQVLTCLATVYSDIGAMKDDIPLIKELIKDAMI